jgi:hypothetical protein
MFCARKQRASEQLPTIPQVTECAADSLNFVFRNRRLGLSSPPSFSLPDHSIAHLLASSSAFTWWYHSGRFTCVLSL